SGEGYGKARMVLDARQYDASKPGFFLNEEARGRYRVSPLFASLTTPAPAVSTERNNRFWLSLREPGCIPDRKGPWPKDQTAKVLREFIAERQTAYIDYITIGDDGPLIEHGPEVLQMVDGRSMSVGRKHNARVREAEAT